MPFADETDAKSRSWPWRARGGKSGQRSRTAWPPSSRSGTRRSAASRATRPARSKAPPSTASTTTRI